MTLLDWLDATPSPVIVALVAAAGLYGLGSLVGRWLAQNERHYPAPKAPPAREDRAGATNAPPRVVVDLSSRHGPLSALRLPTPSPRLAAPVRRRRAA